MILVDARRLTGPNHLSRSPLVVVEITLEGETRERVSSAYETELARMRAAVGLPPVVTMIVRPHAGGMVIGYEAPIDVMLACAETSEHAALSAREILAGRGALPLEPKRTEIEAMLARDRNPRLLAIAAEAKARDLPFLWDDSAITVGAGSRGVTFPLGSPPEVSSVPWGSLGRIPIALITGTNGKTTSARLLARVAREAGIRVGATSSDEITIEGVEIDRGDWTGPAAARLVLRRHDVNLAVLETARGGILRRGLAIDWATAALITNVSEDHVGGYGIDDLAAMTEVKAVVARAVRAPGTVVLNARDAKLVELARTLEAPVVFFADLDREGSDAGSVVARHRAKGGGAVVARGGAVIVNDAAALFRVDEAPITFGGAASYNVENILAVVAMARALGLPDDAIVRAVTSFDAHDNPGRGEIVEKNGVRVLLDFGHNPDGIGAVMRLVASLRRGAGALTVIAASAGDRSNHDIDEVSRVIAEAKPARVIVRDLEGYMRGRAPGEVPEIFRRSLAAHGHPEEAFAIAASEVEALRLAFADARPGDFVVVLVHLDRAEVQGFLAS